MKIHAPLQRGFTIVELLIVVAVIAILAAVTMVGYSSITSNAREKSLLSDIDSVESELARYAAKNQGVYSSSLNWDSSSGTNANISFSPSQGNVIVVRAFDSGYCVKGYNPSSKNKTLTDAVKKGQCTVQWIVASYGTSSTCGIATTGTAYCWGSNSAGQLGNNSTTDSPLPVAVNTSGVLSGKTLKNISVGGAHTCAVASDARAYCWGSNSNGQLGNNTTTDSSVAVAVNTAGVLSGKSILSISTGSSHTCVVASDYRVYCWGANSVGQLGNNSTTSSSVPVAVNVAGALSGKSISNVTTGVGHTCALATTGQAYCWGSGQYGRLGNAASSNSSVPVAVSVSGALSGKTLTEVVAGDSHTCALASDGNAYCWGYGVSGRLGNGSSSNSSSPLAVDTSSALSGKTIKDINMGYDHTCAIATDGAVYCWGNNSNGQFGNGTTSSSSTPIIGMTASSLGGKSASSLVNNSGSYPSTCVLTSDKAIYCAGINLTGLFGNGTTTNSSTPQATKPVDI